MEKTYNVHSKKDSPISASSLKPDNVPASPSSQQLMSIAQNVGSNNARENSSKNLLTQPKHRRGRNHFSSRHKQSVSKSVWRQKNQHEIKKDDEPKKNTNSFTDSRARAAVKTAASILGQDVTKIDDEKINKAASVIQNEYVHTMQTVFQAFCSDDEVNKIMDCYRKFFLEDACPESFHVRYALHNKR